MQNYLTLLVTCLAVGLLSSCQSEYNDHLKLHLKGSVKELHNCRYKVEARDGALIKQRIFSRTLDVPQDYEYEILPSNCMVHFNEDKTIASIDMYDTRNKLRSKMIYKDTVFELHSAEGVHKANADVDHRWRPTYSNTYMLDGRVVSKVLIDYKDAQGFSAEHKEYNAEAELVATTNYEYEGYLLRKLERKVEQKHEFHIKKQVHTERIQYDEYNHPTEIIVDTDGEIRVITIEYELDEHNNWIKAVESVDGQPEQVVERKLVYYD